MIPVLNNVQVQKEIQAQLVQDTRLHPNEIGVIVNDGVAILTGYVDSYAKRWAAEEAAQRVQGVKAVVNEIEVRLPTLPTTARRIDEALARAVVHALEQNVTIPDERIAVTVTHGWVTLRGEVDWPFQRQIAEQTVRKVTGVLGVENLLSVKWGWKAG